MLSGGKEIQISRWQGDRDFILRPSEPLHREDEREFKQTGEQPATGQWGQCVPTQHLPAPGPVGITGRGKARQGWKSKVLSKWQTWRKERKSPKSQPWNKTLLLPVFSFPEAGEQSGSGVGHKKDDVNPEQGKQVHACAQMDTGARTDSCFILKGNQDQTRISDTKSWSCDAAWEELTISHAAATAVHLLFWVWNGVWAAVEDLYLIVNINGGIWGISLHTSVLQQSCLHSGSGQRQKYYTYLGAMHWAGEISHLLPQQ